MNTKSELSLQDFHGAPAAPSRCSRLVIAAQQPSIPAVDSLSTATLAPLIWLSLSHLPASLPLVGRVRFGARTSNLSRPRRLALRLFQVTQLGSFRRLDELMPMQIAAQYNPIILTNSQERDILLGYPVMHNNGTRNETGTDRRS